MPTKKLINSEKNNNAVPGSTKPGQQEPKKRGRPKGSIDKSERKRRIDREQLTGTDDGNNSHMIQYALSLSSLPKIDYDSIDEVKQRVYDFFSICSAYDIKPSVAALASAFGIDRATLFNWLTGKSERVKNKACIDTIKAAYNNINMLYEVYMNNGKINPVSAIFLMKNNMGYKDTTDYIVTANQDKQLTLSDITDRSGLLGE